MGKLSGETELDYKEVILNYYNGFENVSEYRETLNKRAEAIRQATPNDTGTPLSSRKVELTNSKPLNQLSNADIQVTYNNKVSNNHSYEGSVLLEPTWSSKNIPLERDFQECLEFVTNSRNYILITEDSIKNILTNAKLEDFPTEIRNGSLQLTKHNYLDIKNAVMKILDNMQYNKNIMPLMTVYNKYKSVIFECGEFKIEANDFNIFKKYIREQAGDNKEALNIWESLVEKTVPLKKHKLFIKMILYFLDKNEKIEVENE
jgi:hypothetical protein